MKSRLQTPLHICGSVKFLLACLFVFVFFNLLPASNPVFFSFFTPLLLSFRPHECQIPPLPLAILDIQTLVLSFPREASFLLIDVVRFFLPPPPSAGGGHNFTSSLSLKEVISLSPWARGRRNLPSKKCHQKKCHHFLKILVCPPGLHQISRFLYQWEKPLAVVGAYPLCSHLGLSRQYFHFRYNANNSGLANIDQDWYQSDISMLQINILSLLIFKLLLEKLASSGITQK